MNLTIIKGELAKVFNRESANCVAEPVMCCHFIVGSIKKCKFLMDILGFQVAQ